MPDPTPQAAALARRGDLVCLITSRNGERWVIPKGHVEQWQTPPECAATEAYEEAGLVGTPDPQPLGYYDYAKNRLVYRVEVFELRDFEELEEWPERDERVREWVTPEVAAERVLERGLKAILLGAGLDTRG